VFEAEPWDSLISFEPGIPVQLGGALELTFADDVNLASQLGRTLRIFDWTGVSPIGQFELTSPYSWDATKLYTTGEVTLLALSASIAGDFNQDGTVDAADYVVWRNGLGTTYTQADYDVWRANFGAGSAGIAAGGGAGVASTEPLSVAVPEPATLVITVLALLSLPRWRLVARTIACS
jgi:hypothetical protein